MSDCSEAPRRLAIGIAPLGIISIGVVPMGVISIGVVPMGVVSLGVVGMGVFNAAVVGMGVVVAGLHTMGVWTVSPGSPHPHAAPSAPTASVNTMAYRSREEAMARARALNCTGVHRMGDLWMPCDSHR